MKNKQNYMKGMKVIEKSVGKVNIGALNAAISAQLSVGTNEVRDSVSLSEKEICLNKYEECMKNHTTVNVRFDACDEDGNFSTYDAGVLIVLSGDGVNSINGMLDGRTTARMLGVEFSLKVVEVDRENACVYCELPGAVKWQAKQSIRAAVQSELRKAVESGNRPLVYGRILRVENRRALVDILGQGVLGFIDISHWQKCYTRSMLGMCVEGEYYQFEVIKKAVKPDGQENKDDAWILDRTRLTKDAWSLIDCTNLKPGGSILVTCIEKPVGKTYWWGKSERVPGIEIMGDFTESINPSTTLIEGITYRCWIDEIVITDDHKKNKFKVIPAEIVKEDLVKVERYRKALKPQE